MSDHSSNNHTCIAPHAIPSPPPLPTGLAERIPHIAVPLLRIPGMSDEGGARAITLKGRSYSVTDVINLTRSKNSRVRLGAVKVLGSLQGLNRSELHLVASTLHSSVLASAALKSEALVSLSKLFVANSCNLEAIFLGVQILTRLREDPDAAALYSELRELLSDVISSIRFAEGLTKRQLSERRYILLKAIEVSELRESVCESISAILQSSNEEQRSERRELAGNLLAYLRTANEASPCLLDIKRLASSIVATGTASISSQRARTVDVDRLAVCTTALQAEMRRQFGLACSIEISKATTLLGRSMRIEEYEKAITFSASVCHSYPANLSWFSREEWDTAARLLTRAGDNLDLEPRRVVAMIYTLATRIKAEDHSDPRESRRKIDRISPEVRRRLLNHADRLRVTSGTSVDEINELVNQLVRDSLPFPFDSWRFDPSDEQKTTSQHSGKEDQVSASQRTVNLVEFLMREDNPNTIARIGPEDLHLLRQVEGLDLNRFKTITDRLLTRAISDSWALAVILDMVRLPHEADVTARVRTATLGALITHARRMGKLSADLESKVFAVSAEIPALPFLTDEPERDYSTDEEIVDNDQPL